MPKKTLRRNETKTTRTIGGEDHELTAFRILSRDQMGRPSKCEVIYQGGETTTEDGEEPEFMTGWLPQKMLRSRMN